MYHHILSYLLVPVARIELAIHRLKVCCHTTWLHEHKKCGGRVVDTTLPLATGLAQYSYPFIRAILLNLSEFLSCEIQGYRISTYQRRMPCDLGSLVALERCGPHVIGAGRWGRTTRVIDSRFTVCPASIYGISQHIKLLGCAVTPKEAAIIHKAPYIGRLICVAYDGFFAAGASPLLSRWLLLSLRSQVVWRFSRVATVILLHAGLISGAQPTEHLRSLF